MMRAWIVCSESRSGTWVPIALFRTHFTAAFFLDASRKAQWTIDIGRSPILVEWPENLSCGC